VVTEATEGDGGLITSAGVRAAVDNAITPSAITSAIDGVAITPSSIPSSVVVNAISGEDIAPSSIPKSVGVASIDSEPINPSSIPPSVVLTAIDGQAITPASIPSSVAVSAIQGTDIDPGSITSPAVVSAINAQDITPNSIPSTVAVSAIDGQAINPGSLPGSSITGTIPNTAVTALDINPNSVNMTTSVLNNDVISITDQGSTKVFSVNAVGDISGTKLDVGNTSVGNTTTFNSLPTCGTQGSPATVTLEHELANKSYVDGKVSKTDNDTVSGTITFTALPESTQTPTDNAQLTTKLYVDSQLSGVGGGLDMMILTSDHASSTNLRMWSASWHIQKFGTNFMVNDNMFAGYHEDNLNYEGLNRRTGWNSILLERGVYEITWQLNGFVSQNSATDTGRLTVENTMGMGFDTDNDGKVAQVIDNSVSFSTTGNDGDLEEPDYAIRTSVPWYGHKHTLHLSAVVRHRTNFFIAHGDEDNNRSFTHITTRVANALACQLVIKRIGVPTKVGTDQVNRVDDGSTAASSYGAGNGVWAGTRSNRNTYMNVSNGRIRGIDTVT
jgi:hypothetical protein